MVHLRAEKVSGIARDIPRRRGHRRPAAASCSSSAGARPRRHPRRGQQRPAAGPLGQPRPSALSESVPPEPGRGARALRPRAGARDEPGPARAAAAGPLPQGHHHASTRFRGSRSPVKRSWTRSRRSWRLKPCPTETPTPTLLTKKDFQTDQEVRWCPGCGDYAILSAVQQVFPELGHPAREVRVRLRHRLLEPLSVLHEHLRLPHHPRPGAGGRDRAQARPARAGGLGRHRRRRRAVDRRQSPDAHAPPQRRT